MIGVDTTFLVQLELVELPAHEAAHAFLQRQILQPQIPLALAPQVLAEFIHIVPTRAASKSRWRRAKLWPKPASGGTLPRCDAFSRATNLPSCFSTGCNVISSDANASSTPSLRPSSGRRVCARFSRPIPLTSSYSGFNS